MMSSSPVVTRKMSNLELRSVVGIGIVTSGWGHLTAMMAADRYRVYRRDR